MIVAPGRPCSVCNKITWRGDGLCDGCWKARQLIEASETQAELARWIQDLEADWRLMDRIDYEQRKGE